MRVKNGVKASAIYLAESINSHGYDPYGDETSESLPRHHLLRVITELVVTLFFFYSAKRVRAIHGARAVLP